MRYCIVSASAVDVARERTGFYLWATAFRVPVMSPAEFFQEQEKEPFDLIHLRCEEEEYDLLKGILTDKHRSSVSKVIVSVERFLQGTQETIEKWKTILKEADLVTGAEQSICSDLYKKTGIRAIDLCPPADIRSFQEDITVPVRKHRMLIIAWDKEKAKPLLKGIKGLLKLRYTLTYTSPEASLIQLWNLLRESIYVIVPEALSDGGRVAVLAALTGCPLIANADYDPARMLFPFSVFPPFNVARMRNILSGLFLSKSLRKYVTGYASVTAGNFSPANKRDQMIHLLGYKMPHLKRPEFSTDISEEPSILSRIIHSSGPAEITYGSAECIVICLLKDGEEHLPAFLKHYRDMGIVHFVFIDNGSVDNTLPMLAAQPDVTLYRTDLPHRFYEIEIRRLIAEKHGRHRWCLLVDIDELFDYPDSDTLPLQGLLQYLRSQGCNAMAAQMLDMYSPTGKMIPADNALDLKQSFPCYDISAIRKEPYFHPWNIAYNHRNELRGPDVQSYWGGIRKTIFKGIRHENILTKHPLIFLDGRLKPVTNAHFSDNACIAGITGVLYHYKFVPSFAAKVIRACRSRSYVRFAQDEYDAYYRYMKDHNSFIINTPGTRRLGGVNELVANGFLQATEDYKAFLAQWSLQETVHSNAAFRNKINA